MKGAFAVAITRRWKMPVMLCSILVATVLCFFLLLAYAQKRPGANSEQIRPRRASEEASAGGRASILRLPNGGDFQKALNGAKCGDTIVLEAGATYQPRGDGYVLPKKPVCSSTDADYITIQTSDLSGISSVGERINPTRHAAAMPKLVGAGGTFVMTAATGAHHYKFIGVEITTVGNRGPYTPDL